MMSAFIDFSYVIDLQPARRKEIDRAVAAAQLEAEIAAEEACLEQAIKGKYLPYAFDGRTDSRTDARGDLDKSLPPTSHTATHPAMGEKVPILQRLGKSQRVKEFFRPSHRKKRIGEEFVLFQRMPSHIDEPVEPPLLPGAGLLKLQESEEKPLPASPAGTHLGAEMTRDGLDNETTALPPVASSQQVVAIPRVPVSALEQEETEIDNSDVMFGEGLVAQVSEEAVEAWDSPGNRMSTRPGISLKWRPDKLEALRAASNGEQLPAIVTTPVTIPKKFFPVPNAWSEPGAIPIPNFSMLENSPMAVKREVDEVAEDAQKTPASSR